jgi:hypothetical protein
MCSALLVPATAHACGVERWEEKTLTDQRASLINLTLRNTTVDALRRRKVVRDPEGYRALGVERTVYRVKARLIGFKTEDDGDVHLVIASLTSTKRTMIVEFPAGTCTRAADPALRRRMSRSLTAVHWACGYARDGYTALHGTATITGGGFFDFIRGQTGVAPNGIELHPVLSFSSGTCTAD